MESRKVMANLPMLFISILATLRMISTTAMDSLSQDRIFMSASLDKA